MLLFFAIVLETTKADCATIGCYLGKDHATVVHAKKMWVNGLNEDLGKHLVDFKKIKGDFKSGTTSDLIIECFQQLEHSISIFIVFQAAQIISILLSLISELHSGHLNVFTTVSISHFNAQ